MGGHDVHCGLPAGRRGGEASGFAISDQAIVEAGPQLRCRYRAGDRLRPVWWLALTAGRIRSLCAGAGGGHAAIMGMTGPGRWRGPLCRDRRPAVVCPRCPQAGLVANAMGTASDPTDFSAALLLVRAPANKWLNLLKRQSFRDGETRLYVRAVLVANFQNVLKGWQPGGPVSHGNRSFGNRRRGDPLGWLILDADDCLDIKRAFVSEAMPQLGSCGCEDALGVSLATVGFGNSDARLEAWTAVHGLSQAELGKGLHRLTIKPHIGEPRKAIRLIDIQKKIGIKFTGSQADLTIEQRLLK
jgi:hypothetical protein